MTDSDLKSLATDWIAFWKSPDGSIERDALAWTSDREWELVRQSPQDGWKLVLQILKLDDSPEIQEVLAAGPLEDLLSYHGEAMIGAVEQEARSNARFAHLLGGVWQNAMSEEVWLRVQAVWNRQGWDGGA
jgi:hypothetical protein